MTDLNDRQQAARWAYELLNGPQDWLIFDSETTGLDLSAEFVQIGLLAPSGKVLLDCLVKPQGPIPSGASRIHGIGDADVADVLTWAEVWPLFRRLVQGKRVIIYNAPYDTQILRQTCTRYGIDGYDGLFVHQCAMHWYSQFFGEWSDWHGNYKWQRLPGGDHTAIGDCRATLRVIEQMAGEWNPGA